ncbi:MAG TPA: hypothetical protein C5S51_00660 [Methanosarcinaceae archaeon]|nr:hypothetical protein [Methanosarcinaceae archaeon]
MRIFILSALFCAISIGFGSAAGESPIVVVADQIVTPNQQFTVDVTIDPTVAITGAQFNLLFDSSIATVNSVTEGDLFTQDGASTIFDDGTIDNNAGTVSAVYSSILGATSVSASGTMATISITAGSSTGRLDLNLSNVVIADANSNAASYTIADTSVLIDTAPVLAGIGAKSVDEDNALTFTLSASDADGDSLTYSASNLPDGTSFNTATRVFTWTPADGQTGTYVVTFEVTDGYLTDSESVTITVNEVNHAPVITGFVPANNAVFGETDTIIIDVTASDVDGQALSYTIKIDGVTYSTSSSYFWNTDYSSAGSHTILVTVSDGVNVVTSQRTITINNLHPLWDINEDQGVDILDITIVGQKYGTTVEYPYPRYDVNQDGLINVQDLVVIGYHFGETNVV